MRKHTRLLHSVSREPLDRESSQGEYSLYPYIYCGAPSILDKNTCPAREEHIHLTKIK